MEHNGEPPEEDFIATLLKQSSASSHDNKAFSTTPTSICGPPDVLRTSQPLVRKNGHQLLGNHLTVLSTNDKTASPHASHISLTDPTLDDKVYTILAYGIYCLLLIILTMVTTICLIVLA